MSSRTANYNLIKPEYTDTPDITSMNPNWDAIDEKLKEAIDAGGSADELETYSLTLKDEASHGEHYVAVQYVAEDDVAGTITLTGDRGLAKLTVKTPTQNSHAATKKYVDDKVVGCLPVAGGTVTGATTFNGVTTFTKDADFSNSIHDTIQLRTWNENTGSEILFTAFPESNGISFYRADTDDMPLIPISVGTPQTEYDAATKGYVDDRALPAVTSADNGKILMVVDGKWKGVILPLAEEATF